MPKRKGDVTLSGLIDMASEGEEQNSDQDTMLAPESVLENMAPAKKTKGRSKVVVTKTTKQRKASPCTGQESGGIVKKPAGRKKTLSKRQALKEKPNNQFASDTEEMEEFAGDPDDEEARRKSAVSVDELDASVVAVKQPGKGRKPPRSKIKNSILQETILPVGDESPEGSNVVVKNSKAKNEASSAATKVAATKQHPSAEPHHQEKVIPETQQVPMDVDQSIAPEEDGGVSEPTPHATIKYISRKRLASTRNQSQMAIKRAGSASDVERSGNDPATRRRLGELTKKLENLDLKYRNLREVGVKEAEANFERLKKQSEESSKSANELIASLKKELTAQTALAQESRSLQKQLSSRNSELAKVQTKVAQLSTSLSEAQNENKVVQAKLAASRTAASSVESVHAKTPGSAMKTSSQARTLMVGSAEAAQAAQVAQLKEDLYSDLTGLILRGVKRSDTSDVYDCIQTGRNGTLHFKLAIATEGNGKGSNYENTEFQYTPHLDTGRDKELLELLPDYLTEEITFSRLNAAKFYGRVVEALTKKRPED
ncbi:MAG: hypothetical protein M1830_009401 [Pleopsidium flavum]|nr:MAG: hypothetical protein M1830_009401 [Pleopsidium flavum]